jgi:hypothetical protein
MAAKRQLLEIVCLNFRLDGATLVPAIRQPFEVLAEGLLVSYSRDDRTPIELFLGNNGMCRKPRPCIGLGAIARQISDKLSDAVQT